MSPLGHWYLVIGVALVSMALIGSMVKRAPFTPAIIYLGFGYALGSYGTGLHPILDASLLRTLTEIAVAISLFAVGLKLRLPLSRRAWRLPLALGLPAMVVTIAAFTAIAVLVTGLPWVMCLLMSAILAPTDPVLGSDVQIERPGDRDHVRFGLTAEGGINDGLAAPGVRLALGLMGLHALGEFGWRWFALDVVWFIIGGTAIGWLIGVATWRLVIYLRSRHALAVGLDEFLGLGVIGIAFATAGLLHASDFLSVFAAGLALRNIERRTSLVSGVRLEEVSPVDGNAATDPERAAAHMAQALLTFNEQAEHIAELAVVTLLGALVANIDFEWRTFALAAALFLVARPLAVVISVRRGNATPVQTWLISWFGVRGIGSVYYLAFALEAGVRGPDAERLTSLVLGIVAISIVIHGISATPLMHRYHRYRTPAVRDQRREDRDAP